MTNGQVNGKGKGKGNGGSRNPGSVGKGFGNGRGKGFGSGGGGAKGAKDKDGHAGGRPHPPRNDDRARDRPQVPPKDPTCLFQAVEALKLAGVDQSIIDSVSVHLPKRVEETVVPKDPIRSAQGIRDKLANAERPR